MSLFPALVLKEEGKKKCSRARADLLSFPRWIPDRLIHPAVGTVPTLHWFQEPLRVTSKRANDLQQVVIASTTTISSRLWQRKHSPSLLRPSLRERSPHYLCAEAASRGCRLRRLYDPGLLTNLWFLELFCRVDLLNNQFPLTWKQHEIRGTAEMLGVQCWWLLRLYGRLPGAWALCLLE